MYSIVDFQSDQLVHINIGSRNEQNNCAAIALVEQVDPKSGLVLIRIFPDTATWGGHFEIWKPRRWISPSDVTEIQT